MKEDLMDKRVPELMVDGVRYVPEANVLPSGARVAEGKSGLTRAQALGRALVYLYWGDVPDWEYRLQSRLRITLDDTAAEGGDADEGASATAFIAAVEACLDDVAALAAKDWHATMRTPFWVKQLAKGADADDRLTAADLAEKATIPDWDALVGGIAGYANSQPKPDEKIAGTWYRSGNGMDERRWADGKLAARVKQTGWSVWPIEGGDAPFCEGKESFWTGGSACADAALADYCKKDAEATRKMGEAMAEARADAVFGEAIAVTSDVILGILARVKFIAGGEEFDAPGALIVVTPSSFTEFDVSDEVLHRIMMTLAEEDLVVLLNLLQCSGCATSWLVPTSDPFPKRCVACVAPIARAGEPFQLGQETVFVVVRPHRYGIRRAGLTPRLVYRTATDGAADMAFRKWLGNQTNTVAAKIERAAAAGEREVLAPEVKDGWLEVVAPGLVASGWLVNRRRFTAPCGHSWDEEPGTKWPAKFPCPTCQREVRLTQLVVTPRYFIPARSALPTPSAAGGAL